MPKKNTPIEKVSSGETVVFYFRARPEMVSRFKAQAEKMGQNAQEAADWAIEYYLRVTDGLLENKAEIEQKALKVS